jgi:chromosome segregation ATPase
LEQLEQLHRDVSEAAKARDAQRVRADALQEEVSETAQRAAAGDALVAELAAALAAARAAAEQAARRQADLESQLQACHASVASCMMPHRVI